MERLKVFVVVAACSGCGPATVGHPSRGSQASVTLAPSGPPAARYNDAAGVPPASPLGNAVVAAVRDIAVEMRTRVPVADARLFRACAELAQVVSEDGVIPYPMIEFALQRNGMIEPSPNVLVVWGDLDAVALIVDQVRSRLAAILAEEPSARVGVGAAARMPDGSGAVVIALQTSGVTTAPIPRALPAGGGFVLEATVDPRYRDPKLHVMRHDGRVELIDVRPGPTSGITAQVDCEATPGKQQIEISARDARGSFVLANFPVWCGEPPPASMTIAPSLHDRPVVDSLDAERRMLAIINRDRRAAGVSALTWDERVAQVARAYAQEMRSTGRVTHVSLTTGTAADRLRAAKVAVAVVNQNVARAYSLGEAHDGLTGVPSVRKGRLSTEATHIGIGVVFGDAVAGGREMFIHEMYTRAPRTIEPAAAVDRIHERIAAVRPVGTNPALTSIAQEFANQLAAGKTLQQATSSRLAALASQYRRVERAVSTALELDRLDGASLLGENTPDDIGVGVARDADTMLHIVILFGTRR